jgi:hypothetical protein
VLIRDQVCGDGSGAEGEVFLQVFGVGSVEEVSADGGEVGVGSRCTLDMDDIR